MKTRSLLLAIVLLVFTPVFVSAQIGSMLKNRVGKALNAGAKAIGNEADSTAKSNAEAASTGAAVSTGQQSSQQPSPGGGVNIGGLFGGKVDLKYSENYSYNSKMYMAMELYDKKEVTKMDYNIYFHKTEPNAGIEMKTVAETEDGSMPFMTQILVDGVNKCFIMLTDAGGMKIGMISAVPDETAAPAGEQPAKPPVVTKTGNTKVIAGFKCDEYLYREADKKEFVKMWLTNEAALKMDKRVWSTAGMPAAYGYSGFEGMVTMAWESYDDKNTLIAKSEVKEINNNFPYSMSPKGYSLRQVNLNQMATQQKK